MPRHIKIAVLLTPGTTIPLDIRIPQKKRKIKEGVVKVEDKGKSFSNLNIIKVNKKLIIVYNR